MNAPETAAFISSPWESAAAESYLLGDLAIHYEQRRVRAPAVRYISPPQNTNCSALSRNAGRTSTYEVLLRQVWGGRHNGDTQLVRTFMKKLRRMLGEDPANPACIVNERGVGHRMTRRDGPSRPGPPGHRQGPTAEAAAHVT